MSRETQFANVCMIAFGAITILGFLVPAEAGTYADAILAEDGLVAYYRLDEGAGTVATNAESTAALNGSYVNSPTRGAVGPRPDTEFAGFEADNTAMANAGTTAKGVKVLKASLGVLTNWTLEAWANSSNVDGNAGVVNGQNIFSRDASGWNDDVLFGLHPEGTQYSTQGHWSLNHQDDGGNTRTTVVDPAKAISGQWYHVVATCDNTSGTLALYVNGVLVSSHTDLARKRYLGSASSDDLWIGSHASAALRGFIGTVDEAAVYNRALDASEILAHYQVAVNFTESDISALPTSLDFGSVETISSSNLSVAVSNTGSRTLIISGFTYDVGAKYSVLQGAPIFVPAGGTTSLTVRYSPGPGSMAGTYNDTLHIASNDPDSPTVIITLHGVAKVPMTTDYATAVLAEDGLVAYYRLDERAGTVATNAKATAALNGSYVGSPTLGAVGPRPDTGFVGFEAGNTAMANTGCSTNGVKVLKAALGVLTNWTLEAWANSSDVDGNSAVNTSGQNIFSRDASGYNDDVLFGLHPEGTGYSALGYWTIAHQDNVIQDITRVVDPTKALSNQWYHVVATCDDTTGTMALYVNGVLVGSHTDLTRNRYFGSAGSGDLWIGSYFTVAIRGFIGTVDEAAVYDRALGASEVAYHYACALLGDTRPKGTMIRIK